MDALVTLFAESTHCPTLEETSAAYEELARELEAENAALSAQVVELQKELDGWKRYKAGIDDALNAGDGSYRP